MKYLPLTDRNKALLITFLISGSIIMCVFSLSLKQKEDISAESYYVVEPEVEELTEEDIKILEALEKLNAANPETNKAFNTTKQVKHFAQAYKSIAPPEDFNPKTNSNLEDIESHYRMRDTIEESRVKKQEIENYDKVKKLLKDQQEEQANTKSTVHYTLVGRTHVYLPVPVYLCEIDGQVIINITVNSEGTVVDTKVSSSSKSSNQCLIEHAKEYAKNARFNEDLTKNNQLGSITFYFVGKH